VVDDAWPIRRYALLLGLLGVCILVSLCVGPVMLTPAAALRAIIGNPGTIDATIVRELRAPRAIQAALVGGALGMSGVLLQTVFRNPLADPYVLGIASGAAIGAVSMIAVGLSLSSGIAVPIGATVGAIGAVGVVLQIAKRFGDRTDLRVVLLSGVIVGTFCNAAIMLLLSFADADVFRSAMFWMMGSNSGAEWHSAAALAALDCGLALAAMSLGRSLDVMLLGDESAMALGVDVDRIAPLAIAAASVLTACAVAVSGIIGFVGLIVPHAARRLWPGGHLHLLPAAALLGAAALSAADALARTMAAPTELPIGAVTAAIGGPFFLYLLRRAHVTR
jgi:iron complex transport system permease protein